LLSNLKQLGHEVHFFLLDKEYRSNHVAQSPDIDAMQRAWDGFDYLRDRPRMALGGVIDRFGLSRLRKAIRPREAKRTRGRLWKLRSAISNNMWRIDWLLNQMLRAPFLARRSVGKVIRVCCPPLYRALKPRFPDHKGLPLDKLNSLTGISQIDSWYNFEMDPILQALQEQEKFDTVIVEYVYLSRALTNFREDVYKIIDTHDVFTDRKKQYEKIGLVETFFSTSRWEETKGLSRANAIIAIQDQEKELLRQLTNRPVFTVGHTVPLRPPVPIAQVRKAVLFVGAGNSANVHSVNWFAHDVMPLLRQSMGEVSFCVAGQVCEFIQDQDHLIKLGEISDADDIYKHADVVINAATVGTGLKIKCIEALGRGKVLVSTPHAGAGLSNGERKPYIEVEGAQEFAAAIINICTNVELYNAIASQAYTFAQNYNKTVVGALEGLLDQDQLSIGQDDAIIESSPQIQPKRLPCKSPNFIIIASARTGSTTLADLLEAHPAVSCLAEPFNPEHGIKWGKKRYCQQLEDGTPLHEVVRDIFSEYTGFKHLAEQLTRSQNEDLIQFPNARRIFLWRRNHLQRAVSNHISMQAGHWKSDSNKILVAKMEPLDIERLTRNIEKQKRRIARFRDLCKEAGCFEVAYEDMFGPDCSNEKKHEILDGIFDYLNIESFKQLPSSVRNRMDTLLNPDVRKLNSELTYRLIPNFEEIEKRLGSPENGYLLDPPYYSDENEQPTQQLIS